MGQAFRRATSASSRVVKNNIDTTRRPPPPPPPPPRVELKPKIISKPDNRPYQDSVPQSNPDNVLEDKDPGYDAMLSQMVGRIKTKPGGKLEMGEAFIVEKYDRPMPKLRNTKPESNFEEKVAPPGTLNVAQLREMLLLHQSKTKDHNGTPDVQQTAEKFRLEAMQVQKILQFVSLPPEDRNSKQQDK